MKIKKGDKFIILKYGTGLYDCINQHLEVINSLGYCWFGKIGVAPSEEAIYTKLNKDRKYVILYCQGKAHLCDLLEVSSKKPEDGYPKYYDSFLYDRNIFPKMYFKLGSISPLSKDELSACTILSSGKPVFETISRSMASFFYAEYPEEERTPDKAVVVKSQKKTVPYTKRKAVIVDKNSCSYRREGICFNKKCINYQYDCGRPSACTKQKPIPLEG